QQRLARFPRAQRLLQGEALAAAAVAHAALAAGTLYEDAAHGLGRGREEVPPVVPRRGGTPFALDQPQVGFVNEGRGLEGLAGLLLSHLLRRQPPQLVGDQRPELRRGLRVALTDGLKDPSDLMHGQNRSLARGYPMTIPPAWPSCPAFSAGLAAATFARRLISVRGALDRFHTDAATGASSSSIKPLMPTMPWASGRIAGTL